MHHAPLVSRFWKHGVDGGDESRAAVSDHQSNASQTAFDHAADELLPAGPVLLHALRHADHLAMAVPVNSDGDRYADVLDRAAP